MPRAFWKGVISFGMVAIPIRMYVATETKPLSFHLLHKKCMGRAKQVLYCPTDEEYFSQKDTVRGFEFAKDQYVTLTEDDFKKVPIKTSHAVNILSFVEAREIDPVYYYGSHYLEPEELGAKPFRLLTEALQKTGLAGIAKVVFQRREHLCCIRPLDDILVLHTIHYQDEIKSAKELAPPKVEGSTEEMQMAVSLIKAMVGHFEPKKYKDEYQSALKQMVESKMRGEKVVAPAVPKFEVGDLMAALRASVEAAKKAPVGARR
jgi:DNA end-binding protein Ku